MRITKHRPAGSILRIYFHDGPPWTMRHGKDESGNGEIQREDTANCDRYMRDVKKIYDAVITARLGASVPHHEELPEVFPAGDLAERFPSHVCLCEQVL
jgi:hypothetical protein